MVSILDIFLNISQPRDAILTLMPGPYGYVHPYMRSSHSRLSINQGIVYGDGMCSRNMRDLRYADRDAHNEAGNHDLCMSSVG